MEDTVKCGERIPYQTREPREHSTAWWGTGARFTRIHSHCTFGEGVVHGHPPTATLIRATLRRSVRNTDRKKGVGEWSVEQQHTQITQLCDTDACFFTSLLALQRALRQ